jgi:hypothetical protein
MPDIKDVVEQMELSNRRCDSVCQTNAGQDGPLHNGYTNGCKSSSKGGTFSATDRP